MKFTAVACLVEGQFRPAMENGEFSIIMTWNPQTNIINQGKKKI
jgi:hypothetical protein